MFPIRISSLHTSTSDGVILGCSWPWDILVHAEAIHIGPRFGPKTLQQKGSAFACRGLSIGEQEQVSGQKIS